MAKRKPIAKVIVVLAAVAVLALLATAIVWFKQYYDYRYALEDYYYTVVPLDYDFTPTKSYNSNGEYMGMVSIYNLMCYNADGVERELEFRVLTDMHDLYPPGTYVKVSASRQWAIGKSALAESDVPEPALERIKAGFTASPASTLDEYADERTKQLRRRGTPPAEVFCALSGNELVYTYIFGADAKELAAESAELLDLVYKSQFRTDEETFPELDAIRLEIKLDDGTMVFSNRYDEKVRFGYELE
jgi:uncharacterized protein YxeA